MIYPKPKFLKGMIQNINHKDVIIAQMDQVMENREKGGDPIIFGMEKYVLEIWNE